METAAPAAGPAQGKAKHYGRTWATLLETLENPDGNCPVEKMNEILKSKREQLLEGVGVFKERSAESEAALKEGKTGGQALHKEWQALILQFSEAVDLDALQAYQMVRLYLAENIHLATTKDFKLEDLIEFYYYERSCLLGCLCALLRIRLAEEGHMYWQPVNECLQWLVKSGLEQKVTERYTKSTTLSVPKTKLMMV